MAPSIRYWKALLAINSIVLVLLIFLDQISLQYQKRLYDLPKVANRILSTVLYSHIRFGPSGLPRSDFFAIS